MAVSVHSVAWIGYRGTFDLNVRVSEVWCRVKVKVEAHLMFHVEQTRARRWPLFVGRVLMGRMLRGWCGRVGWSAPKRGHGTRKTEPNWHGAVWHTCAESA